MLPKIRIISKKASIVKTELLYKKSGIVYEFPPSTCGAMTLERLIWLEYNIVLKLQITLI